jgi:hypothetical protein
MSDYLSLMFAAIQSPRGIAVATSDPDTLRQRLYKARRESPSPETFSGLGFLLSPSAPKSELWIVKTSEPPDAAQET